MKSNNKEKTPRLPAFDLRTKKRRAGEALWLFEEIIDREVTRAGTALCEEKPRRPKLVPGRPHEIVIWEAPDS
jgi:hypothetical protein